MYWTVSAMTERQVVHVSFSLTSCNTVLANTLQKPKNLKTHKPHFFIFLKIGFFTSPRAPTQGPEYSVTSEHSAVPVLLINASAYRRSTDWKILTSLRSDVICGIVCKSRIVSARVVTNLGLGHSPLICPFSLGNPNLKPNAWFFRPTRVQASSGSSICSSVLAQFMAVSNLQRVTDHETSVTILCIFALCACDVAY